MKGFFKPVALTLMAIAKDFEASSGQKIAPTFVTSDLLPERIEKAEAAGCLRRLIPTIRNGWRAKVAGKNPRSLCATACVH